jgi:hypothetical protein
MRQQIQQLQELREQERASYLNLQAQHHVMRQQFCDLSTKIRQVPGKWTTAEFSTCIDAILTGDHPMFTQQHYIAVAAIIKAEREKLSDDFPESAAKHEQINQLQLAFIRKFEADNPKFNKLIFIGACGEQPEPAESE